jgi:DNA-binding protein HU-beta
MNKNDLVESVSKKTKMSKASSAKAVDAIFESITSSLKKKNDVRLIGFGTFATAKRAARQARNPRTGQKINVPACTVPKFRPGKDLKNAVNG